MAVNLGSAYGKVNIDASGVVSGVAQAKNSLTSLSTALGSISRDLALVGGAMTIAITTPLILLAKKAVDLGSTMEEVQYRVNTVFGSMSDAVEKWSQNSATAFGLSKLAALDAVSQFGNLFTAMGIGKDKATEMSEKLVKMSSDLAVFNHIDPTVATDKLMSALTGLPRPLKELGIVFTEDDVKAKALQMGLISAAVSMDDVNNAANRLKIAQMELADAQQSGGVNADKVATAQERVSKATEAVDVAQTNLQRTERDLDALEHRKSYTALELAHAQERVADAHRRVEDAINGVADAQGNLTKAQTPAGPDATRLASAQEKVAEADQKVTGALNGQVGSLTDAAKAQATYQLILEQSKNSTGAFAKNSNDLSVQLMILKANWEDVLQLFATQIIPIVTAAVKVLNSFLEWFKEQPKLLRSFVLTLATIAAVIGPLLTFLSGLGYIASGLVGLAGLLGSAGLATLISTLGTALADIAGVIFVTVIPAIGAFLVATAEIWVPILLIVGALVLLYLAWKNNFLGIHTIMTQFWTEQKKAWAQGWDELKTSTEKGWAAQKERWSQGWNELATSTQSGWAAQKQRWSEGWDELVSSTQSGIARISTAWKNFVTALGQYAAQARDWIINAFNIDWGQIGRNIINGIVNGFQSALAWLISVVKQGAQEVLDAFDSIFNSHSPSMEMFKRGQWISQGLVMGMNSAMDPSEIAKIIARPVMNMNSSSQQNFSLHFANGVSIQQVQAVVAQNNEQIMQNIVYMLGA